MLAIFWFLLLLIFSLVLIKVADFIVHILRKISLRIKANTFVISAILVGLGTCLPEIVVAITSGLEGRPSLSLGNALGANIADISLVVGLSAFILGGVNIHTPSLKKDLKTVWLILVLFVFLLIDGEISRVDGLILIFAYFAYLVSFLSEGKAREEHIKFGRHPLFPVFNSLNNFDFKLAKELVRLFIGLGILLFSAEVIVNSAVNLTAFLNISVFDVGLIFLAVGTTLPELAFSFRAIKDDQPSMFLGNILGSLITNWTLVVGIAASIQPIVIGSFNHYLSPVLSFVILFAAFNYFLKSKNRFERWEAAVLLSFYIIFLIIEFA